jgi:ornithine--oxo-acid transaminase
MMYPNLDVSEMFSARQAERSDLHGRYLNEQLVKVLKTISYDVGFVAAKGHISWIAKERPISIC